MVGSGVWVMVGLWLKWVVGRGSTSWVWIVGLGSVDGGFGLVHGGFGSVDQWV